MSSQTQSYDQMYPRKKREQSHELIERSAAAIRFIYTVPEIWCGWLPWSNENGAGQEALLAPKTKTEACAGGQRRQYLFVSDAC